jgi:SAM-dependent methyltransferase
MAKADIECQWLDRMGKLKNYNQWLFSQIKDYLGDSVWEVGSGEGTYSQYMTGVGSLVLSDIEDEHLRTLKGKFKDFENVVVRKIDLVSDDCQKLNDYNIDTVVGINVLEHVGPHLEAMRNIYKALQPGGRFLFIGPHHPFLYGSLDKHANHFRRYTRQQLISSLNKIGFKIEKIFVFNLLAAFNWFLQSRVFKRKIISSGNLNWCEKFLPFAKLVDLINPFPIGSNIVVIARK